MPHRVNQWNFTDRGSQTCHNDYFRGKGNATYTASNMRSNQGFASVKTTFPQGSFATCRFPDTPDLQRTAGENTWHPAFVGVSLKPQAQPAMAYNTSGTKPLPVPFSQRPGYEEEQRKAAEAAHAKYLAFKSLQLCSTGDVLPPDYHEHTIYSKIHAETELKAGQIFRPSKERVGTTPSERLAATQKLEATQRAAAEAGQAEAEHAEEAAERARMYQRQQEQLQWRQAAYDARREGSSDPIYYNIPDRR